MSEDVQKYAHYSVDELREQLASADKALDEYVRERTELRKAIRMILDFAGLDVDEVLLASEYPDDPASKDWVEDQLDSLYISR